MDKLSKKKDQDSENPRTGIKNSTQGKPGANPDVDYIIEVIREMAYILINKDKEFDIVIKLKEFEENNTIKNGCLTDCNVITSDTIINSV
ncbi:MAG: hypothetical protein WCJ62_13610 [Flavobacterium sp.]